MELLISILPVAVFLGALVALDSYKLVRIQAVLVSVAVGEREASPPTLSTPSS